MSLGGAIKEKAVNKRLHGVRASSKIAIKLQLSAHALASVFDMMSPSAHQRSKNQKHPARRDKLNIIADSAHY